MIWIHISETIPQQSGFAVWNHSTTKMVLTWLSTSNDFGVHISETIPHQNGFGVQISETIPQQKWFWHDFSLKLTTKTLTIHNTLKNYP
jgi:sugar diacid utilization regulator